jgi:molecular chaperone GrpE (heat shock protein)
MRPLEGLDPTAEAENDMRDVEDTESDTADLPGNLGPDLASMTRALRELEAAKARVERDAARAAQEMRERVVHELLPLQDNLDRTIRAAEHGGDAPSVVEGVRLVRSQFASLLARYGVERIDSRHKPFDPAIHEAVGTVPVSHPAANNVVVDQIEAGYRMGNRLLRPAKVVVGRHQPRYH